MSSAEYEDFLIKKLKTLHGDQLREAIAVLTMCGGKNSAAALAEFYFQKLNETADAAREIRGQCLRALGSLGGPESVAGLVIATLRESETLADAAAWKLIDLENENVSDSE